MAWQNTDAATSLAVRILRFLFRSRLLLRPAEPCAREPCPRCFEPHLEALRTSIREQKPLLFVLPGFPAKSPNPQKVLGPWPDLAEQMALRFLHSVCEQLSQLYPPGARVVICSTGLILGDLLSVPDETVTAYRQELEALIAQLGGDAIGLFSVEQSLHGHFEKVRGRLLARYAEPLEQVRERASHEADTREMLHGLTRLLLEDEQGLYPERSPSRALVRCRELASRLIQRGDAWSRLIAERFPQAVRLSVYPQAAHSAQLGLQLVQSRDSWLTPWHGALLEEGGRLRMVKRHEAERLGATLVWRNHRPSHFVLPLPSGSAAGES